MKGSIPIRIGNLIDSQLYGGRYKDKPDGMFGVKMAVEINLPYDANVPTMDFNVPNVQDLKRGVLRGLMAMYLGRDVYAGCMGGIGRTGLYLATVAKVMSEYRKSKHRPGFDPVLYVRSNYYAHAVETDQQMEFIASLDVSDIVKWCSDTQSVLDGQKVVEDAVVDELDLASQSWAVAVAPTDLQPLSFTTVNDHAAAPALTELPESGTTVKLTDLDLIEKLHDRVAQLERSELRQMVVNDQLSDAILAQQRTIDLFVGYVKKDASFVVRAARWWEFWK